MVDHREINLNPDHVSLSVKGTFKWKTRGPITALDTKTKKVKKSKKKRKLAVAEDVPDLIEQKDSGDEVATGDFALRNIDIEIKAGELVAVSKSSIRPLDPWIYLKLYIKDVNTFNYLYV
jgi:hypothetical protein